MSEKGGRFKESVKHVVCDEESAKKSQINNV